VKIEEGDVVLANMELIEPETQKGQIPGENTVEKNKGRIYIARKNTLPGEVLIGKEEGEHEVEIDGSKIFGPRREDFIMLMQEKKFIKVSGKRPVRGMEVIWETEKGPLVGKVLSVSSGRVLIDFNHPLAGKKLRIKVKVEKIFRTPLEKLSAMFNKVQEEEGLPVISIHLEPGNEYALIGYMQTAYRAVPDKEMEFRVKVKSSSGQKSSA